MQQLAFDFDIPAAVKAKPQPKRKMSDWDAAQQNNRIERKEYRKSLPDTDSELLNIAWKVLNEYHATVVATDVDGMLLASNKLCAIKEHAFGMDPDHSLCGPAGPPQGNGKHYCLHDAGLWMLDAHAATDGDIPLFGQKGRFVIEIAGCRVDFRYSGLFGICGGDAHVIDLGQPYFSETGYRSFQVCPMDYAIFTGDADQKAYFERVCTGQLTEGGKKKIKLHNGPFGLGDRENNRSNDFILSRRQTDPAWQEGGHLFHLTRTAE
ncbi:hypothetical protein J2X72_001176 [Phyllobacterium sp. 1468]|uniref:hypothetical protein n=1 Tax=Phyllobacterium sp. 1468 TaxID=2817759 RepID=UPI00285C1C09|nr:hypothetical protein [Phyllobacterium sp. 1468]MDR6632392.1 hypothetical protein [Phyllobacterium sp. 1468]